MSDIHPHQLSIQVWYVEPRNEFGLNSWLKYFLDATRGWPLRCHLGALVRRIMAHQTVPSFSSSSIVSPSPLTLHPISRLVQYSVARTDEARLSWRTEMPMWAGLYTRVLQASSPLVKDVLVSVLRELEPESRGSLTSESIYNDDFKALAVPSWEDCRREIHLLFPLAFFDSHSIPIYNQPTHRIHERVLGRYPEFATLGL